MKKIRYLIVVFCALATLKAQAQYEGTFGGGTHVNYADKFSTAGIGAHLHYSFANEWRIAPSYTYYVERRGLALWTAEADLHYMIPASWAVSFYPLAGLNYARFKKVKEPDYGKTSNKLGANIGLGIQYDFRYRVCAVFETKYQLLKDYSQFLFSAGIGFWF